MTRILSLETSGTICSVAIHERGQLLAADEVTIPQSHASRLVPLIQSVLKTVSLTVTDLAAVAVSAGPGSYTGLRIGTSTAKGLCYAGNIPLIAVGSLDILAHIGTLQASPGDWICPMLDARRMEVYCMMTDQAGNVHQRVEAKILDEGSFDSFLKDHKILFLGDGAGKFSAICKHPNAYFASDKFPTAAGMGTLAWKEFEAGHFQDLVHFEPFYLKEFMIRKPGEISV
jgi:tRNA threonylcarbamoyladenosine biosynthesis protein TsaB